MSDKKNIDRLFQEKFKDYEVSPDSIVWENIEKQLSKKKKRRVVPLWLRFAGAAAILFLITFMGYQFFSDQAPDQEGPGNTIISDIDEKEKADINKEPVRQQEGEIIESSVAHEDNDNSILNTTEEKIRVNKIYPTITNPMINPSENTITYGEVAIVDNDETNTDDNINEAEIEIIKTTDADQDKFIAQEVTDEQNDEKIDMQEVLTTEDDIAENVKDKDKLKKWSIGSTIAPVYYNTLSNGSPIDASLSNNSKSTINSLSYGLKLNYKLTDKITLQSGINTVDLGYSTKNVATLLSSSLLDNSGSNINTNVDGVSVATVSTYSQNNETLGARTTFDVNGSLDQNMSYVEVPLEAKYNVLQRKFGINVVGGFSTYVLYQNSIQQTSFGKRSTLGEASNLNTLNFSGNLGLDFDYNFSKKLFINISPMFKYQFNTFSEESGGFQPYYFGIYTGLNFRF